MKSLLKLVISSFLFLGFSIGSYWLIFNQGMLLGLVISFGLLVVCVTVIGFSLYGIHIGHLEKLQLKTRMEVAMLLILTVYLSSAIGLLAIANTLLELKEITKKYTAAEKTEMLLSSIWNNDSPPDTAGKIEKNGVVYSFTASTEDEVDKVDEFLELEKERITDFFGNVETGNLTIVFHDEFDTLSDASGYDEAMGYYDYYSQEIHIVPDDYSWDTILLHEYVHYQSHLYAESKGLSETRLPLWFEEGIADYLAGGSSEWYELEDVEIIDFKRLDNDYSFHSSYSLHFDPYAQSFLAVESLVLKYGEEVLPTFLPAKMPSEFYKMLEKVTGMALADFQETFLDEMIEESHLKEANYDAAYEAMENEEYEEAAKIIDELTVTASEEDLNHLSWLQVDLYLMQDRFDEAIQFTEKRLENSDSEYRIDDLLTLAELYVLIDPEKSLKLIKEAEAEMAANDDTDTDYYNLATYLEAYELINSTSPLEGYTILLDEELLYNEIIIDKVKEKMHNDFSQAS